MKEHVLGALPQTPKFLRHFEYRESQRKSQIFHWLSRSFTQNIPYQFVLPHSLIPLLSGMDNMPHERKRLVSRMSEAGLNRQKQKSIISSDWQQHCRAIDSAGVNPVEKWGYREVGS